MKTKTEELLERLEEHFDGWDEVFDEEDGKFPHLTLTKVVSYCVDRVEELETRVFELEKERL